MTRESKLALIIGFVLVLIVGVLVSDHFSQASSMSLDTQARVNDPINTPSNKLGDRDQLAIEQSIQGGFSSNLNNAPASDPSSSPYQPVEITSSYSKTRGSLLDKTYEKVKDLVNGTDFVPASQPHNEPGKTSVSERPLPEPKSVQYTVAAGDSLIRISRRYLGDGERWKEIHELNADQLGPDAILKVGMTLRLPADARMQAQTEQGRRSAKRDSVQTQRYTVKAGDTLGEISMDILGTSKRADEIAQLNGLSSPNEIYVGMVLKVPSK